jgi:hypothetical protein
MILLFDLELGLVPYHLDLPALPLPPADQIAKDETLEAGGCTRGFFLRSLLP